jgi:hypothetical protein
VAVDAGAGIVGLQVVDRWSPGLTSMAHVGQVGTFLLPQWRRRGLWAATTAFAACGRLSAQVVIDGVDDDEVLMECFLGGPATSDPAAQGPATSA